jgi:predicted MarR family transcription regulator
MEKVRKQKSKHITTISIPNGLYDQLYEIAHKFGFRDVDVLISDLVYYYCIKNRMRLSRKAFAKRKPNKLINVTMTRRNSTTLTAYANTIGADYNTIMNQIIKSSLGKLKEKQNKLKDEENSGNIHESVTR